MRINQKFRGRLYQICTLLEAGLAVLSRRTRQLLGFKLQPDSRDVFLRLFLLHMFGRQPTLRITCAERSDGAAAQAHTIISAMNFARACGHTYVHTPFAAIDHADRPPDEWVAAWESLFNLGENEEQAEPGSKGLVNYSTFHPRLYHAVCRVLEAPSDWWPWVAKPQGASDLHFQPFFYFSDSQPDSYNALIPDLRRKYYHGKSPVNHSKISVAVHVRRGDVGPQHPQRFTAIEKVRETARLVERCLQGRGEEYSISVYSQGEAADFSDLQELGAVLFLDADPIWTMQQLIEADILIMSKSSFSYVAALIGDGIKLYEPFWHAAPSAWIVCAPAGGFDRAAFEIRLQRLIDRRQVM